MFHYDGSYTLERIQQLLRISSCGDFIPEYLTSPAFLVDAVIFSLLPFKHDAKQWNTYMIYICIDECSLCGKRYGRNKAHMSLQIGSQHFAPVLLLALIYYIHLSAPPCLHCWQCQCYDIDYPNMVSNESILLWIHGFLAPLFIFWHHWGEQVYSKWRKRYLSIIIYLCVRRSCVGG